MMTIAPQFQSGLRYKVVLAFVISLSLFWLTVAWNYHEAETQELRNIRRETVPLALLFANQAKTTFEGVDHVMLELRKAWLSQPTGLADAVHDESGFLGRSILQVAITDARGFMTYSSLGMPKTPLFLGDREHVEVQQAGSADKLFVSRPVQGRVSGKWSIQLSRPIVDKGQFAGVIVVSVDPDYFLSFYSQANMGNHGVATMVRDTGEVMVRSNDQGQYAGKAVETSRFTAPGVALRGSFRRVSALDGIERSYSYVRLPEYGVSVLIGPSIEERLIPVRRQQYQILFAAVVVTLLVLYLALYLLKALTSRDAAHQELVESQVSLKKSQHLLEQLSKQMPGMLFEYQLFADGHSAFTYASDGIERVFEVKPAEVAASNKHAWSRVHPDDYGALRASIEDSARTLQPWAHEFRVLLPNRGLRCLVGQAQPEASDEGGRRWYGSMVDITSIKEMEVAIRKATEVALSVSNHELDTFSYSVSHELRSPLNTINGFSMLLAKKLTGSNDEMALHYLERIRNGTAQMARLIENLLILAQVVRTSMKRELVNLSDLAHSICAELQAHQPDRCVELQIEPGLQAQGDARLLRVMLENLLSNAWKYSEKKANTQIRVGQQLDADGSPQYFVQDKGIGFDMAYAGKLFEPFERLHEVSESNLSSGIGLATASRIVLRHGGRIWAESEPGFGATFFFTLPPVLPGVNRPLSA